MKTIVLAFIATTLFCVSCKKNDNSNPAPTSPDTYINTNAGSSWNYHETNASSGTPQNSDYTITSSSKDTTISTRSYHVYNYSYGGSEYLNISGHDYYQYDSIPGAAGKVFERLYLKDDAAVGISWSQNISITLPGIPLSVPVTITNNIAEKGISRIVNGTTYNNVIHVSTNLTSSAIPGGLTSSIDSYYAKNYGLIENTSIVSLNFGGITENINIATKLNSANLK
jgi:hypothetical protein